MKDTMCKGCRKWTGTLTPTGFESVFCDDRCKRRAIVESRYDPSPEEAQQIGLVKGSQDEWLYCFEGTYYRYNWSRQIWQPV